MLLLAVLDPPGSMVNATLNTSAPPYLSGPSAGEHESY